MNSRHLAGLLTGVFVLMATSANAQNTKTLTLQEAEALAVSNHPGVMAASFNAAAAKEFTTQARAAYFPNVFTSITGVGAPENSRIAAGSLNNPIIYSRFATGLTVSQLISDFGRTANLTKSAKLQANARGEALQATKAEVILAVERSFYAVLRAQNVLKVAEQTVSARQLIADQISELAKSKLRSDLDVSFANVSLSEAKLLLIAAQDEVKAKQADLSVALGSQDQQTYDLVDEPLPSLALPELPQLLNDAIQSRPDLASLRFEQDAAFKFANAERALSFPTVGVLGSVGVIPAHVDQLRDGYSAIGINVNIPIFNGHLFSAKRTEAELAAQAKMQNLRELENQVAHDVRLAWLNVNTALQRIGLTVQLLNQANQALDLTQARYDLGLNSIVDLSQAQLNKTSAEIASASAKYDYMTQRAVLDYTIGTTH
jgi:outer membrane protein